MGRAYTLAELYECCTQLNYFSEAKEIKAQAKALLKNIPYKDVNKYVTKKLHLRQYCANPKNKKCNTVY